MFRVRLGLNGTFGNRISDFFCFYLAAVSLHDVTDGTRLWESGKGKEGDLEELGAAYPAIPGRSFLVANILMDK